MVPLGLLRTPALLTQYYDVCPDTLLRGTLSLFLPT